MSQAASSSSSKAVHEPSPYLDIMTVRNSHVLRDGIEETRQLMMDPVLIPDLEHTGVRPSIEVEDRLLFYPSGCRNRNLQLNVQSNLRTMLGPSSSTTSDPLAEATLTSGGHYCNTEECSNITTTVATSYSHTAVSSISANNIHSVSKNRPRYKVDKQAPNKVHISSCCPPSPYQSPPHTTTTKHQGLGVTLPPNKTIPIPKEGWYDHNGVRTVRKKPTSDREARHLVHTLRSKAHQMGLLVFNDV